MDKNLRDFIDGDKKAVRLEVIIAKEETSSRMQHIIISDCSDGRQLYDFWRNPKPKPEKPKHTGGKRAYLMLMIDEVKKIRGNKDVNNPEEVLGVIARLAEFYEWGTGRLIDGKSKKPLRYADIIKLLSFGREKSNAILNRLRELGYLSHNQDGYFLTGKIINKGKRAKKPKESE